MTVKRVRLPPPRLSLAVQVGLPWKKAAKSFSALSRSSSCLALLQPPHSTVLPKIPRMYPSIYISVRKPSTNNQNCQITESQFTLSSVPDFQYYPQVFQKLILIVHHISSSATSISSPASSVEVETLNFFIPISHNSCRLAY